MNKEQRINKHTNDFIEIVLDLLKTKQQKGYDLDKVIQEIEKMKV